VNPGCRARAIQFTPATIRANIRLAEKYRPVQISQADRLRNPARADRIAGLVD
jgi:hypothetical protein